MTNDELAADPVGPLADEFMERCRRGERPSVTEYAAHYPELADRIRQVFSMIMLMEKAGSGPDAEGSTHDGQNPALTQATPEQVGGYRILREIGRGGMGVVYEAEQTALGRHVALKVLPVGAARKLERLERFQREARSAARLHHTNIVPVYEVGAAGDLCYYAMQFIHGQPLDVVLQELRSLYQLDRPAATPQPDADRASDRGGEPRAAALSLLADKSLTQTEVASPEGPAGDTHFTVQSSPAPDGVPAPSASSLTLTGSETVAIGRSGRWHYYRSVAGVGIQVAEALDYAHREGVIHRDIKPSNLLLDTAGRVWITDFGLAYQSEAPGDRALTQTGEIVGTIRYMPPERFRGWSDPRSDIYSLGLTLYEMLLFRPAFDAPEQVALMERALHEEPVRPRKADPQVPRDLETIVLKAIDKEPGRRYQSAAELAADLKRFLDYRPILARHTGIAERAWRWSRRHPTRVALAASVMVTVFLVAGGWLWQARQEQLRADRVSQALTWAGQLRDRGQWSEAQAAAEPLLLAAEGIADLKRRVEEFLDELRLLERLTEIRASKGDHLDDESTDAAYARAFREYGIDVELLSPEEAARRIRARPEAVARELVAALDDWALDRRIRKPDGWGWLPLVAVAQLADDDDWRGGLRQLLDRIAPAGLQTLKKRADAADLPVQSLQFMGQVLAASGDRDGAVAWLRDAQRRHPGDVWLNYYLARNLQRLNPPRLDEAIGFYRAAVAVRPELAHQLAHALEDSGNYKEAIAVFRELIRLRDNNFRHYFCSGRTLQENGQPDAALTAFDRALELRKDRPQIYFHRGNVLRAKGDLPGARAAYEQAIRLKQDFAEAHANLGHILEKLGQSGEALAAFTQATFHNQKLTEAHYDRGRILRDKNRLVEAQAALEQAIKLKRDFAEAHCHLGAVLLMQGRFTDALAAYREGHELGSKNPPWRYPSEQWIRSAERMIDAEKKLPELRRGAYVPANVSERVRFAQCCAYKGLHGTAARLFEEAFKARPDLMENLNSGHRSRAASSAALAGCGQGEDAAEFNDQARAYWRNRAQEWLRADLRGWTKRFESDKPQPAADVRRILRLWQDDPQLAGIRDAAELVKLPTEEQEAFKRFWADVANLLQRTGSRQ